MRPVLLIAFLLSALIAIPGTARSATNQFSVGNSGFSSYLINGSANPNLTLVRGFTYTFQVSASGHPFWIKTVQGNGTGNAFTTGVTGNGTSIGTVQFTVPTNAPSLLYYNCQFHPPMTGELNIVDPPEVIITQFVAGSSILIASTGSDTLNVGVETSSDLTGGAWSPLAITGNVFANGTNITQIAMPPGTPVFFRVYQGFP